MALRRPLLCRYYQTSEDDCSAGQMIWLDGDGKLRALTGGKRGIDDFAAALFGVNPGACDVDNYTSQNVLVGLNKIAPFDWVRYLRAYLDEPHSPLGGLASHGWKLFYPSEPSDAVKANEAGHRFADLTYSPGVSVGKRGDTADVLWDGPAFKAGLPPAMSNLAVNGNAYSADALKDAVRQAATDQAADRAAGEELR